MLHLTNTRLASASGQPQDACLSAKCLPTCSSITYQPHACLPRHRSAVCRVWDMRTKVQIHALAGHEDNVAAILAQPTDPQVGAWVLPTGGICIVNK